ncbi:MAG: hypothetical protein ABUL46_03560 [Chitinophaga rupis]
MRVDQTRKDKGIAAKRQNGLAPGGGLIALGWRLHVTLPAEVNLVNRITPGHSNTRYPVSFNPDVFCNILPRQF